MSRLLYQLSYPAPAVRTHERGPRHRCYPPAATPGRGPNELGPNQLGPNELGPNQLGPNELARINWARVDARGEPPYGIEP